MSDPFELIKPVDGTDHVLGTAHAPVVVVEYGDFQCPNCKQAASAVKILLNRFENRVQFAYRHFPLIEIHEHALGAAQAAECAGAQGKFWEMYTLLFDNQMRLARNYLDRYAKLLELNMGRYMAEMDDGIYLQRIQDHIESGRRSGVRSTPGFFVNGRGKDVSFGLHLLLDAIEAALESKGINA